MLPDDLNRVGLEVGRQTGHRDRRVVGLHAEDATGADELHVDVLRVTEVPVTATEADDLVRALGEVNLHGTDELEPVRLARQREERTARDMVVVSLLDAGRSGELLRRERPDDVRREQPGDPEVTQHRLEGALRTNVGGLHQQVGAGLHVSPEHGERVQTAEAVLGGDGQLGDGRNVELVHRARRAPDELAVLQAELGEALGPLGGDPLEDPGVGVHVERLAGLGIRARLVLGLAGLVGGDEQRGALGAHAELLQDLLGEELVRRLAVGGADIAERPGDGRRGGGLLEAADVGPLSLGDTEHALREQSIEHALEALHRVAPEREHQPLPEQLRPVIAVEAVRDGQAVHGPDVGDAGASVEENRLVEAGVEHGLLDRERVVGEERVRAPTPPLTGVSRICIQLTTTPTACVVTYLVSGSPMQSKIM